MKTTRVLCAAAAVLFSLSLFAQSRPSYYDTFKGPVIDPSKWISVPMCDNGLTYDCAREIEHGQLRLAARGYGDNTQDTGSSFAASALQLRNPNAIWAMRAQITVNSFSSAACSTNSDAAHPQLLMSGSFFNSGNGDPSGDVQAYFMVERRTDDPWIPANELRVAAFLSGPDGFTDNVPLGVVATGEPVVGSIRWDKENKRFIATAYYPKTNQTVSAPLPYSYNDDAAPAYPVKQVDVGAFVPNCTSSQTFGAMEAHFGYMQINDDAVN